MQWFPGHMAKAKRNISTKLKLVDMVWELVDARIPIASRNPVLSELLGAKPRVIAFNKADLADPKISDLYLKMHTGADIVQVNAQKGLGINQLKSLSIKLMANKFEKRAGKGIVSRRVRVMIVGIPNVGKSALINRMASRYAAVTGDRPGVTRGEQWIRVGNDLEILDTPGLLWPKFDSIDIGMRLALTGAIKSELVPLFEAARYLIQYLSDYYPNALSDRYGNVNIEQDLEHIIESIGARLGCMRKGGIVDLERAATMLLNDFRMGKLGKITLEVPELSSQIDA